MSTLNILHWKKAVLTSAKETPYFSQISFCHWNILVAKAFQRKPREPMTMINICPEVSKLVDVAAGAFGQTRRDNSQQFGIMLVFTGWTKPS